MKKKIIGLATLGLLLIIAISGCVAISESDDPYNEKATVVSPLKITDIYSLPNGQQITIWKNCEDKVVCYSNIACFRDADIVEKYCG